MRLTLHGDDSSLIRNARDGKGGDDYSKAGDRVIWVNEDREDHSVMSSGPVLEKTTVWAESLVIDTLLHPGASYTHSFHEPGTYHYFCAGHMHMWGAVTVEQQVLAVSGDWRSTKR